MVSRVPTYATNQNFLRMTMANQASVVKYNYQTVTGYKGWTYDVYNRSVNRLINFENQYNLTSRFIETNTVTQTRMDVALKVTESIKTDVTNFRSQLRDFASTDMSTWTPDYTTTPPSILTSDRQSAIKSIQASAFQLLRSLQSYLNESADGRYIFSGGATNTAPVYFPFNTLEEFQAIYDGNFTTYPTSSAANLSNHSTSDSITGGVRLEGELITVASDAVLTGDWRFDNDGIIDVDAGTGDVSFEGNTIRAQMPAAFGRFQAGDTITVTGTGSNDGTYTIQSISDDGKTVAVERTLTTETVIAGSGASLSIETPGDGRHIISRINADVLGAFGEIKEGAVITIQGTGVNDGTYYISSISSDGKSVSILSRPPLTRYTVAGGTLGVQMTQDPQIGYIDALNPYGSVIGTITGGAGTTGTLSFSGNTITATNANAFHDVRSGQTIQISGTGSNDGTYYVKEVIGGTQLVLEQTLTPETITNGTGASIDLMSSQHGFVADNVLGSANTSGTIHFDGARNEMIATLRGAFSTIKSGDTIVLNGTGANNGVKQVKYVSDDGRTIVFEDDTPIVTEPAITNGTGINIGITYPIGTTINMSDIDPRYDGYYTIVGVEDGGNRLVVSTDNFPPKGSPETYTATGNQTIASNSYYQGDHLVSHDRINENTTIQSSINAEDSAFEKVIRALGILCQGNLVDTRNPMDANETTYGADADRLMDRVNTALDLIDEALSHNVRNVREGNSDLTQVNYMLAMNLTTVSNSITFQTSMKTFINNNIDNIQMVDPTEAATNLQIAANNLETSMAALSRMLSLSLLNYM